MNDRRPRHALLIGTCNYQHLTNLPSCEIDVAAMAEVLQRREIGAYVSVRPVLDRTADQVRREIAEFLDSVGPDVLALLYFTGHGLRASMTTGEFYFAATDTEPDRLKETAVSAAFVNDQMEGCPAAQKIAILDCCMSGGFVHGFRVRDEPSAADQPVAKGGTESGPRGVFVLSSSGVAEESFAGDDGPTGPRPSRFTGVLVDGLWTGLAGGAERGRPLSVTQLQEYVQDRMRNLQMGQRPLYSALAVDGQIAIADVPLGIYRADSQPGSIPRVVSAEPIGLRGPR